MPWSRERSCGFSRPLRSSSGRGGTNSPHRLKAAGAAPYDPQAAEDTACFVRLSVEKRGLGCLAAVGHTARLEEGAAGQRICQLNGPAGMERSQNQRALAGSWGPTLW